MRRKARMENPGLATPNNKVAQKEAVQFFTSVTRKIPRYRNTKMLKLLFCLPQFRFLELVSRKKRNRCLSNMAFSFNNINNKKRNKEEKVILGIRIKWEFMYVMYRNLCLQKDIQNSI